ncbi:MAG: hypothetical protein N4A71_22870 [Carboxylicivirga sp.]|jgi:transcription elongation GreA/GreB family factor|nr:hypothetical protein [Carboxylicivirga sp.]
MVEVKAQIIEALNKLLDKKIDALKATTADVSDSMKNDTKSSAGDKFETGREMMQMELNNKQGQLNKQVQLKKDLAQIDVKKQNSTADFGSLVISNKGKYFISVALGRIVINNTEYYALSLASPIGQALKGHKQGDSISFNRQNIVIDDVL